MQRTPSAAAWSIEYPKGLQPHYFALADVRRMRLEDIELSCSVDAASMLSVVMRSVDCVRCVRVRGDSWVTLADMGREPKPVLGPPGMVMRPVGTPVTGTLNVPVSDDFLPPGRSGTGDMLSRREGDLRASRPGTSSPGGLLLAPMASDMRYADLELTSEAAWCSERRMVAFLGLATSVMGRTVPTCGAVREVPLAKLTWPGGGVLRLAVWCEVTVAPAPVAPMSSDFLVSCRSTAAVTSLCAVEASCVLAEAGSDVLASSSAFRFSSERMVIGFPVSLRSAWTSWRRP